MGKPNYCVHLILKPVPKCTHLKKNKCTNKSGTLLVKNKQKTTHVHHIPQLIYDASEAVRKQLDMHRVQAQHGLDKSWPNLP